MRSNLQFSALLMAILLSLAASAQSLYGDVNGDGEVNVSDVNEVINVILGGTAPTPPPDDPANEAIAVKVYDTEVSARQFYRIPAIVQMLDGRLLAIADDRHNKDSDIGSNTGIDIVGKFSNDGGMTWGDTQMIANGSKFLDGFDNSHGDAAAVVDRESGKLLIMCASGKQGFLAST